MGRAHIIDALRPQNRNMEVAEPDPSRGTDRDKVAHERGLDASFKLRFQAILLNLMLASVLIRMARSEKFGSLLSYWSFDSLDFTRYSPDWSRA